MQPLAKTRPVLLISWIATAAFAASLSFGCAPADDRDAYDEDTDTVPAVKAGDSADERARSDDKALRRDFCCALKKGSKVQGCRNIHATKVSAWNICSWGDDVLRDGNCDQYESCIGKLVP